MDATIQLIQSLIALAKNPVTWIVLGAMFAYWTFCAAVGAMDMPPPRPPSGPDPDRRYRFWFRFLNGLAANLKRAAKAAHIPGVEDGNDNSSETPTGGTGKGAAAGGSTMGAMLLALGISAMLLLCAAQAHGQTTIAPDTVKTNHVIINPNGTLKGYNAWVNVQTDCAGVIYNGVADDHTAAQNCITANPKKRIFFPCIGNASGFDMYSSVAITIPNNFVSGCGDAFGTGVGTVLKFGPGSAGLILTGGSVTVQDLNVLGSDPAPSTSAQAEGVNLLIPAPSLMNEYDKTISTVSRSGGTTTVRFTNVPHWYPANGIVTISGVSDTSFNGTFYIATTSQANTGGASSFTYTQAGAPDVVQASLGGTVSLATTYTAAGNGIEIRQSFIHLQNVSVEKFGLNGVAVMGSVTIADDWRLDNVNVTKNRAHGFKCSGGDCNAGTSVHLSPYLNGLWGIFDVGFLGNTHFAPQASYNFGGAGQKPVAGATKTITSISRTGSVLSVTTSTAHGFSVGHGVFFAGTSGALYDTTAGTVGCFVATVPTTDSFTCTQPGYALADQGSTASGTVRLGSWAEVTTGASIDGGPFTVGRTGSAGHWLMERPYDEGGQGPNKYNSCCVIVTQQHSGGGIDANWRPAASIYTSLGFLIENDGGYTNKGLNNSTVQWSWQGGSSAAALQLFNWKDHAAAIQWGLNVATDATAAAQQWGLYHGSPNTQTNPCFVVFRGTGTIETRINAGCGQAGSGASKVVFNSATNSGTGGVEVWSGGASPTKVGGMDGAGIFTWAQQTTAANKYVTAGVPTATRTITYQDNSYTVAGTNIAQSFTAAQTFTQQITSSLATGTAPFVVSSTTAVANLTLAADTQLPTISTAGKVSDSALSAQVTKLGSTIGGNSELDAPAVGSRGGVESKACTGTDKLSSIGTDGVPVCTADQSPITTATDNTVDLASVGTGACTTERTVAVTGAAFGDQVHVMAGTALEAGTFLIGKVSSAGNTKWQFCNLSGGAVDRASDSYTIKLTK
jgi:hypothetical protein